MAKVQIRIEDGTVRQIDGLPTDLEVEVFNCDVDNLDRKGLSADEDSKTCEIKEWHARRNSCSGQVASMGL